MLEYFLLVRPTATQEFGIKFFANFDVEAVI